MKDKRPKDSIFYDSIKNERRNQEETINFYKQNENSHTSTRKSISPVIGEGGSFGSSYTYKGALGSGYTYKRKEAERTYLYGFTNSRLIYFLGVMEPRAYLVFVTLIALLILEDLNEDESFIIYRFVLNVAYAMGAVVDQEVILNAYNLKHFQREQGAALQKDFETLYAEINRLKKEMSHLKS